MDLVRRQGDWMCAIAPAKVNLFLHITGRRDDGLHELESLFVFTDFGDEIRVRPADSLTLRVTGPFAAELMAVDDKDNLVMRAARGVQAALGVQAGAEIILEKNLPIAAGIGGGSSDAAATIRALEALWQISLDELARFDLAESLGADVPACLDARPKLVRGIGEKLEPFDIPEGLFIVLANPGVGLSTPEVFGAYKRYGAGFSQPLSDANWAEVLAAGNDLEASAHGLAPSIKELPGVLNSGGAALKVGMSGSGATCFALFETKEDAANSDHVVRASVSGAWSIMGRVIDARK